MPPDTNPELFTRLSTRWPAMKWIGKLLLEIQNFPMKPPEDRSVAGEEGDSGKSRSNGKRRT